jgi:hypothetical protein
MAGRGPLMIFKFKKDAVFPVTGDWIVGDTIVVGTGKKYLCADADPHSRKNANIEKLVLEWLGHCDDCGERYSFKTGKTLFQPIVNCPRCQKNNSTNQLRGVLARRLKWKQNQRVDQGFEF